MTSLADGIAAAVEIRRQLLKPEVDPRALYKVTTLAAKVGLRAEGYDHPGDVEALTALAAHPYLSMNADVVQRAKENPEATRALAFAVLKWWSATFPDITTVGRCPR